MTNYAKVTVTKVTSKTFDDGNVSNSFQTSGTGAVWLRGGKNRHAGVMEQGNVVDIETSVKGQTTYLNSAVLVSGAGSAQSGSWGGAAKPAAAATAYAGYDSNRQSSIEYQSARNAAIEYLKLAVGSEAIKLPEKPAAKLKAMDALLDAYTSQFYTDVAKLGAVKRAAGGDDEEDTATTAKEEDDE